MNQVTNNPVFNEIRNLSGKFEELAQSHRAVVFKQECEFALQALKDNSFLMKIASNNPDSLRSAILNVASCGISLNPQKKHAYLVPRKGKVCLDVSYQGLIHIASDEGKIVWVRAETVRENDTFKLQGLSKEPLHDHHPFQKRGETLGVYCCAKLQNGDILTHTMTLEEINAIKNRSEAFKRGSGPWITDTKEMIKKTCIKQASKLWPKHNNARLEKVIDVVDEHEGIDFEQEQEEAKQQKIDEMKGYRERLDNLKDEIKQKLIVLHKQSENNEDYGKKMFEITGKSSFKEIEKAGLKELHEINLKLEESTKETVDS